MDAKELPKELFGLITKAAPLLGTALGGPTGTIVGSLIANLFGADPKKPEDILKKIMADPEYEFKLQKLEQDHEENLKNIQLKKFELEVSNVKDAREYNFKTNNLVVHVMAIGYSGLFALLCLLAATQWITIDHTIFLNIFSIAMIIVNYYFGSSHRPSHDKK